MRETMNLIQISKILDLNSNTVRTYLGNYRFSKYITKIKDGARTKEVYKFNKSFIKELSQFLYLRQNFDALKLLTKFCESNMRILDYEEDFNA